METTYKLLKAFIFFICLANFEVSLAQSIGVGINTSGNPPHNSAGLDVDFNDKGILIPRLTNSQRDVISSPADGLLIFNLTTSRLNIYSGGYWFEIGSTCVNPPSAPTLTYNTGVAEGEALNLTASTLTGASYYWTGPNGFISNQQNPSISNVTLNSSGTFTCIAIVNTCSSAVASINVTIQQGAKFVFVTSTTHNGNLGGLAGADAICQSRAISAGLPGSYKAWLSSSTESAASRLNQSNVPYKLVNGTQIAPNWTGLTDGVLDAPISINENGMAVIPEFVWTNTNTNGNITLNYTSGTCNDWNSSSSSLFDYNYGFSNQSNSMWTLNTCCAPVQCNYLSRLYCIQQ